MLKAIAFKVNVSFKFKVWGIHVSFPWIVDVCLCVFPSGDIPKAVNFSKAVLLKTQRVQFKLILSFMLQIIFP